MRVCVYVCACKCSACRVQGKESDPLGLELQLTVASVLPAELGLSARAAGTLDHQAICLSRLSSEDFSMD